jgi:hypothetical protein
VLEDAGIELLPWQSEALTTRLDLLHKTAEELLTKRMMKDVFILVSFQCIDVSEYETVSTYLCTIVSPIHIEMYWCVLRAKYVYRCMNVLAYKYSICLYTGVSMCVCIGLSICISV